MTSRSPAQDALEVLYSNASRAEKERANGFLESFQKSADSWATVLGILDQGSTADVYVKCFAAQTLRSKTKYDLHQLTDQAATNLRDTLLRLFGLYCGGPRVIMIQICIAIAALGMQLKTWDTVIDDVVAVCGTNSQQSLEALLQFLAVLPEEAYDGRRMILTDDELDVRFAILTSNADYVLTLLITYAQSPYFKANPTPLFFTCLASWLTVIDISKIVKTPLLHLAFESLFSDVLFDAVVDFIVSMFRETRDVYNNTSSIKYLYDELYALGPKLGTLDNSDPDVFQGISRIYVEAGEAWVVLIAQQPEMYEFIVRAVAQCTEYNEDLEVTKTTFNFWYELTQLITVDKHRRAKELFAPIYSGLVDTMIKHLHYPEGRDRTDIFKADRVAEDKFRDFRYEMGDVLKDCCRVVGGSASLHKATFLVRQKLEDQRCGVPVRWQDFEAPLFSMRLMAREVDTESKVVADVMKLLVSLPEHDEIRYAATLVLGRYTEWTAKHPEYLEYQLSYISSGFDRQSKDVISAAAQALKHFCQDCKKHLVNHVAQLYPFYRNVSAAQFGQRNTVHKNRFVRQCIDTTKGNPTQDELAAGQSITMESMNGQAAPEGGFSNKSGDSHRAQDISGRPKRPRKFNPRRPGRRGKQQCRFCRTARQGWECVIDRDDPQRRCTHCVQRDLPCSDRTWGAEREERMRREAANRRALLEVSVDRTVGLSTDLPLLSSPGEVIPAFDAGMNGPRPLFTPLFGDSGPAPRNLDTSSIMRGFEALTSIFPNVPPTRILSVVLTINPSLEIQPETSTDNPLAPFSMVNVGLEISAQESAIQESSVEVQVAQLATDPDSIPVEPLLPEFSARDYVEWPNLFDQETPEDQENSDGGFPNSDLE